ncbi:MAG: bifunctional metallophosphatase/5'-nucleotidase [Lachnospiraceae bacterium]|nr:bifunctional metallophosphatase/5'-nucleotidase [Candidatus Colinaster equi]
MKRTGLKAVAMLLAMTLLSGMAYGCGAKTDSNAPQETGADAVSEAQSETQSESDTSGGDITIVYTNDVHSYIDNVVTDDDGNVTGDGFRFSKIAAMVSDMKDAGENVLLVDAGDEIQGSVYGAMDEGENVINIMKATGYQLATPGNHDFDYGVIKFLKHVESAGFPYVTCNFHPIDGEESALKDSYVFDIAGKKVAFVGVTTPGTFTSSTPAYFQNEKGEFIYTIDGLSDSAMLYESVQKAIDEVKDDVDYVVGIGHLGVGIDEVKRGWDSKSVIANVSGLDAFIDGHSHTVMECENVKDKDGKDVVLTQTGCYLSNVGVMKILSDGTIETKLVQDYEREDENVAAMEQEWISEIDSKMNEKIAVLENKLYITNPENDNDRRIRAEELNLGDFSADAMYWFFNERLGLDCDIVLQNGGGIRDSINSGDVTYATAKNVEPFGNMVCLISATGQQIIDALEMGTTVTGEWDDEWDSPAENGGFMQVAGMRYTIDATIPSSVQTDENDLFKSVDGEYRVRDVEVYNKESGKYEPIEPDKYYQLGGINYLLRNSGNGLSMFADDELTVDYVGQDYVLLAEYIKSFEGDGEYAVINTKNSPLSKYKGYQLDYDNPMGAGRITIVK